MNTETFNPRREVGKSLDIIKAPKQKPVTPNTVMNHERERDKNEFFESAAVQERSDPLMFYLILGLCAIVLLVVLSVAMIYRSIKNPTADTSAETTSQTATEASSQEAVQTEPAATDATAKPAEEATTPAAATPAIDKTQVKIRVVNGNGRNGEASLVAKALKDDGFTQITSGNALSRYKTTVVYYKTGKLPEAQAVENIVKAKYKTSLLEDTTNTTKDNDVLVALGNE
jgi:cytoskeletal protein RodZ